MKMQKFIVSRRHLDVGLGLIGDLHDELSLSVNHML